MPQNLLLSFLFHISVIMIAVVSFPFIAKKPIDIPPLVSVELIQNVLAPSPSKAIILPPLFLFAVLILPLPFFC